MSSAVLKDLCRTAAVTVFSKDDPEYLEAKRLLKFLDYFLPASAATTFAEKFDCPGIYRRQLLPRLRNGDKRAETHESCG